MTNYENLILNSLRAGASVDTVADEITKALNSAKATIQKEDQEKKNKECLNKAFEYIRRGMLMYINIKHPKLYAEADKNLTVDLLQNCIEEADKQLNSIEEMFDKAPNIARIVKNDNPDDVIKSFLRDMGL